MLQTTVADVEINSLSAVQYTVGLGSTPQCGGVQQKYSSIPVDGKLKLKFNLDFRVEAAGITCSMYVYIVPREISGVVRPQEDTKLYAGTVHIEPAQTYKVEKTWDLVPFGVNINVRLLGDSQGSCSGFSAGLSGIIPIGVVKNGDGLSLHIRSGIFSTGCLYDSSPPLQLKKGWTVTDVNWKEDREGDLRVCFVGNHSGLDRFRHETSTSLNVHAQMECGVGPDNNNGIRLTLQSVTLVGPPNQTYEQAFR